MTMTSNLTGGVVGITTISPNWNTNININTSNHATISLPADGESLIIIFKGHPLITIHRNGKIEKHPSFTTDDEVSLKFWEVLMDTFDIVWWKGLVKHR